MVTILQMNSSSKNTCNKNKNLIKIKQTFIMEQKIQQVEAENAKLKHQLQFYEDQQSKTTFINDMSKWIPNFKPITEGNKHIFSLSGKYGNKSSHSIRTGHKTFFDNIVKPYVTYYNSKNMFLKNHLPYGQNKYAILMEIYTDFITEGSGDCKDDKEHNQVTVTFFFSNLPADNVSQPRALSDVKFWFLHTDNPTRYPPTLSYKDVYGITI